MTTTTTRDVLCVGHASYDLVFSVERHPGADEKVFADAFLGCGGGPAANAAVAVARLGFRAAFAGYLGDDHYGELHLQELRAEGVDTGLVVRGAAPTPLSAIIVKPDGKRALINYKGDTRPLAATSVEVSTLCAKAVLFDGHEPHISVPMAHTARQLGMATVLDAGSLHAGTEALIKLVDYAVCSEKFAQQYTGMEGMAAVARLAEVAPVAVVTLGEHGLVWRRGTEQGAMPAFPVKAIDTTGAGDAFHGAFAAAIAAQLEWSEVLRFASAAGALCCTQTGARPGMPGKEAHRALLQMGLGEGPE